MPARSIQSELDRIRARMAAGDMLEGSGPDYFAEMRCVVQAPDLVTRDARHAHAVSVARIVWFRLHDAIAHARGLRRAELRREDYTPEEEAAHAAGMIRAMLRYDEEVMGGASPEDAGATVVDLSPEPGD